MQNLAQALEAWARVVGHEHVVTEPSARTLAESATLPTTARVPAIVRPASREEVQACLRVANEHRVPVYPVSTGKNWAFGSRVPVTDCVLLDLGRMNRILAYDARQAYVTIEPGVTMKQLHEYLEARGGELIMSPTGSGVESGLIGNAVERGLGVGPNADRFANSCGLEVILPTGECIHTGYERFANPLLGPLRRWGVGPHLDGIFSQSNLGVVTRLTLWLSPRPAHFEAFLGGFSDEAKLPAFVDRLQLLYLDGTLRTPTLTFNGYKGLTLLQQFPWTSGRVPLGHKELLEVLKKTPLSAWNFGAALYGSMREQTRADRARVKDVLRGYVDRLMFIDDRFAMAAGALRRPVKWATGLDVGFIVDKLYRGSRYLGVPSDDNMIQPYWRKRMTPPTPADPDADRCGFLCCPPTTPFNGRDVANVVRETEATFTRHGFEPAISFVPGTPRCLEYVNTIIYDRDVAGEDERALRCHDETMSRLIDAGYLPYRLGLQGMRLPLPEANDESAALLRRLKETLDPNGILAPGRYDGTVAPRPRSNGSRATAVDETKRDA